MPVYYFDVRDSSGSHTDETGIELPDMDAAIAEGRRALVEMSRDADQLDQELQILIRDHGEGPVLLALSVTAQKLPDAR